MKYLILEVTGSTLPVYLNIDKIVSFTPHRTETKVTLEGGREVLTPVPVAMLHERIEHMLQNPNGARPDTHQVEILQRSLGRIQGALQTLPTVVAQEFFVQRRINWGWLPSLMRRGGLL